MGALRHAALGEQGGARIESKGYGAAGSKMTYIIVDIEKIIAAKRPDTAFLLFYGWPDLEAAQERSAQDRRISERVDITRICTYAMADQFEADLGQRKAEFRLWKTT
jgi:hypothetical protein